MALSVWREDTRKSISDNLTNKTTQLCTSYLLMLCQGSVCRCYNIHLKVRGDNLWDSVPFFYHMDLGDWNQTSRHLYPLSHLGSPWSMFNIVNDSWGSICAKPRVMLTKMGLDSKREPASIVKDTGRLDALFKVFLCLWSWPQTIFHCLLFFCLPRPSLVAMPHPCPQLMFSVPPPVQLPLVPCLWFCLLSISSVLLPQHHSQSVHSEVTLGTRRTVIFASFILAKRHSASHIVGVQYLMD